MKYKLIPLAFLLLRFYGCSQHLFTDYRSLDQTGMWSSSVEELKKLNTSDTEVGRLKNTGLSEAQIMERINRGLTDAQADKEAAGREAARNHANTGFTRVRGRRPR